MPNARVWSLVLIVGVMMGGQAFAQAAQSACTTPPVNLRVADTFRPLLADLFDRSATLQRQCLVLADAPDVEVFITSPLRLTGHCRARATFVRTRAGGLRVFVEIPGGMDFPELLAHELEHVLEQIEGVDLSQLARVRQAGVRQVGDNSYETDRANAAGRAAARELAEDRRSLRIPAPAVAAHRAIADLSID